MQVSVVITHECRHKMLLPYANNLGKRILGKICARYPFMHASKSLSKLFVAEC